MKRNLLLIFLLLTSVCSFAQLGPIIGPSSMCIGDSVTVSDTGSTGGTWTSSNTAVATIGSSSGFLSAISAGVATITYTSGSSYVTSTVTVAAGPASIVGGTSPICPGTTTPLTDATSGGIWTSFGTSVATVGSASGVVTGVSGGSATIEYSIGTGCNAYVTVTVISTPIPRITGPTTVCSGSTAALVDTGGTGGTWSSSNTAIATVGSTGVVSGITTGTVTITLTYTGACSTTYGTYTITVTNTTNAGAITGGTSVTVGSTITLSDPTSSSGPYSWSSSSPSIAGIGSSSGLVTGVSTGITTITYSVSGCGGTAYTTATVSVNALNGISGYVNFSGGYSRPVTVYLITYDPATTSLAAYDSLVTYCSGDSVYYQFTGLPTDSFRVKAATSDTFTSTTGFIPTYHTSHFYWYNADVIYHVSGTSDVFEDINMSTGTITSGPGFISGNVLTGANKGTSGGIPVVGLRMCILNTATGQLMGAAYTNTSGNYTFSNLPVGQMYTVFPDSLNYLTTPYAGINLTSSGSSMAAADFIQHTISHTITPIVSGIKNVSPAVSSVITYPNPTTGTLNIQWVETANENAAVSITDIAGREVYHTTVKMTSGGGATSIDLSDLTSGLYIVTIKSGNIDYNNKIQLQR